MPSPATPDIDRILEAIRAEARARGSKSGVGAYSTDVPGAVAGHGTSHGLPMLDPRSAGDFLSLPLDVFLGSAYRRLLGREADSGGATHYQRALLNGRLTRIEVLGRLALSPEGRRRGNPLPGLLPAFILASAYRIPLAGPLLGLVARALRLPAHWQDRSGLEAAALAAGTWMKR